MKKISERAVELLVERYKKTEGPSPGYSSFHDYMTGNCSTYPNPMHAGSGDILQALDEYQAEQEQKSRVKVRLGE